MNPTRIPGDHSAPHSEHRAGKFAVGNALLAFRREANAFPQQPQRSIWSRSPGNAQRYAEHHMTPASSNKHAASPRKVARSVDC